MPSSQGNCAKPEGSPSSVSNAEPRSYHTVPRTELLIEERLWPAASDLQQRQRAIIHRANSFPCRHISFQSTEQPQERLPSHLSHPRPRELWLGTHLYHGPLPIPSSHERSQDLQDTPPPLHWGVYFDSTAHHRLEESVSTGGIVLKG